MFIFFFGCLSQTQSKNTEETPVQKDKFLERQSRYILPIEEDFPQDIIEILQTCRNNNCYVDVFLSSKKGDTENTTPDAYYFLHSGDFALLIKGNNQEPLSRPPTLKWHRVNGFLSYCVGDPLQYKNIGLNIDREISLELTDKRYKWIIDFNGNNTCELNGTLTIGIFDESIDTSGLIVNTKPWTKGGSVYLHEKMLHLGIEMVEDKSKRPF